MYRQNLRSTGAFLLLAAAVCLFAGCGARSDVDLFDLSGSVTFDGKPIVYGQIDFIPDHSKGNKGPQGFARIIDGTYDTADRGKGVVKGPHEIRITAYEEQPPLQEDETIEVEGPEPLFVGFTMNEELNPPNQDFAVPAEAQGFNLLSAPARRGGGNEP